MPVKNTVAVERRTDLASLFCMIGRHGPAVALAVIAMVSVVAGFIFYRNVRGKRRKATVGEADGAERDASTIGTDEEPEPEPELSESTDTCDEGSSHTKVDPELIQSGPRIRHRRSPSAEKLPTFCPPPIETSAVQDCARGAEPHEEEDIQSLQSDPTAEGVKDGDDYLPSLTDDTATNVKADCNIESYLEPELVYEEKQDWCHATKVLLPSQDDDRFQTTEVTEFRGEDNLHNLTEVALDVSPPEIDEHQLQDENKEDDFAFSEGDVVGACGGECEEVFNYVSCLNQSAELAKKDEGIDAKVEASDIVYLDLTPDDQRPQSEERADEVAPVLVDVVKQNVAEELCLQEEIASEKNESGQVVVVAEESVEHLGASCHKDQQSDGTESREMIDGTGNPSTDAPVGDEASFNSSVVSHPDTSASSHSDQIQNASTFPEVGNGAFSDMAGSQISLSLSESQLTRSLSGFGGESGISSMAVSPDLSDALDEFRTPLDHVQPSAVDCHPYSEEQAESQIVIQDTAVSFNEDLVGLAPESCQNPFQQTGKDWAMDSSFAVNEDIFGNDIEDGYHSTMGQLIAANTMNLTDELTKEACDEVPVLVVPIDGKEGAKKKEEEDFEKTEISIMEATMDNNEWITDGNYQVLPWMNQSTTSFPQISPESDPPPDVHPFFLADNTSVDTDIPPSTEASQIDTLSLEENLDGSKKVLAVQPMPQNVNVAFHIHYLTQSPYQKLAITGSHEELGNWKEFILLDEAKDGHWSTVVGLPVESHVEWKFVVLNKGGVCRWEECGNRLLETGYGEDLIVQKWWGFL